MSGSDWAKKQVEAMFPAEVNQEKLKSQLQEGSAGIEKMDANFVVICALEMELQQAMRAFKAKLPKDTAFKSHYRDGCMYNIGVFPHAYGGMLRGAFVKQARMGIADAAILTTKILRDFAPELVVMTGICAGVRSKVALGDLIVADPTYDYGSGKVQPDGNLDPEPYQHVLNDSVRTILSSYKEDYRLNDLATEWGVNVGLPNVRNAIHIGPNACGAAVVANRDLIERIIGDNRKVVGIEMETYGVARSVHQSTAGSKWLCVKGVSDFADETKDSGKSVREYCAYSSAAFVRDFLLNDQHFASFLRGKLA